MDDPNGPQYDERNVTMKARDSGTASSLSPIDSALSMNNEYIMSLEKQIDVLAERILPVSSRAESPANDDDIAGLKGSSPLLETISGHGRRLYNLSNRLSKITHDLEV